MTPPYPYTDRIHFGGLYMLDKLGDEDANFVVTNLWSSKKPRKLISLGTKSHETKVADLVIQQKLIASLDSEKRRLSVTYFTSAERMHDESNQHQTLMHRYRLNLKNGRLKQIEKTAKTLLDIEDKDQEAAFTKLYEAGLESVERNLFILSRKNTDYSMLAQTLRTDNLSHSFDEESYRTLVKILKQHQE